MQLFTEEKLVFSSIKINPSDDELAGLNSLLAQVSDWKQAEKLLIDNNAAQFLYRKLPFLSNKTLIPDAVFVNLKQAYLHTFRFNFALYDAFTEVMKKFDENGIKVIALKGVYLAEKLYNDIGLRQMSDIDLLVQARDAEKSIKILDEMGYVADHHTPDTPEERMIHFPAMRRGETAFEIKRMLDENEGTTIAEEEIFAAAEKTVINNTDCYSLQLYYLLIFVCLHAGKHFYSGNEMSFKSFYDIVNILETNSDKIDWQKLSEKCRKYCCEQEVLQLIALVSTFFNVKIPETVTKKISVKNLEADADLLLNYLRGQRNYAVARHYFSTFRSFTTAKSQIRFVFRKILFPSYFYMIERYEIRYKAIAWAYYPYRWYLGLQSLTGKKR